MGHVYADDVNLLGDSINTIRDNTESSRDCRSRHKCREDKVYDYVLSSVLRTESKYKDS
jgi:hypothetical protein